MRYHTQLKINLSSLERNISKLKKIAPKNKILFMIKANAYGHGLGEISQFATNELGIEELGCASLGEAIYLRRNYPHINSKIIVFSDTNFNDESLHELYLDYNIIPVIHMLGDLESFLRNESFKYCPLYLKFDTGMNRLGLNFADIESIVSLVKKSGRQTVDHLMTHFASSYLKLKDNDKTNRQYSEFKNIKKEFLDNAISVTETSVSNSGAIEQEFGLAETHIRPGLMLYGPPSAIGNIGNWNGECISNFQTKILKTMPITKGAPIGYGGHVCGDGGVLAYLPVGYGDGVLTSMTGSEITHKGHVGKIIGRINMDLTCVYFKIGAEKDLIVGDKFSIWTHDANDVSKLAHQSKTIPYQLFCGVTSRVNREFYSS